ncbi:ABC transporter ATP-binding protein [Rhodococcus sp. ACPA4]|uniref:Amino acid/amide ABC transporter ATP-binding protein 2 (HAAT family) n=1 Tax=Nocardia globerula TaxID=1818 RepID=A0A652YH11_NOCGL|nr:MULTISPECIES: ABC transporter ATP-binding protein [Rhodococcus]NMD64431.1 ABC transporter ATP-binding protein [Nocardia globerula]MCE4263286.1 ABC transporter ATP-binding protein [Rhodococcus globerulus]PBC42988.1 ABC transporter ATP-binding protein [Rhodococcus sp. ACPA4]PVX63325.1 amino acid/amide ABC transporter ATP-binding protein 2 (HAAT family) [Rhodococcus globerulus]RZL20822.1 MAG: ABC transporter ATP-binding protein [Rhodococcus sp. (in: high G+C Gram-positive bacteria)]
MTAVLKCTDMDAGYSQGRPCVRDFDLELREGEILALLGPNGAGKTTMLLTLAGLLPSLGGTVEITGHHVKSGHARSASDAGLVFVPDDRALFTTLTVEENLRLAVKSRRDWAASREKILGYFPELDKRLKVHAGALSGGEQQMLAIGRALIQHPKVLLIDELSMGLAPVIVERLLPVLRTVADATGTAVILVEQHVQLALTVADTALVLRHGDNVLQGDAAELAAHPHLIEDAYLGANERPRTEAVETVDAVEQSTII